MYWIKVTILYLIYCNYCSISISLNGKWKGIILSTGTLFDAEVPGGVYSDLEKNGLIKQNLAGFNDINNRWIANTSVAYITKFEIDNAVLNAPYIILVLHGLDTFATIYVNNIEVGKTTNMFLKYNFEIKKYLKIVDNELKIIFESSVKVAEKIYNDQSQKYIVPPKCVPHEYNGECHINHIRKMQASYGWDWGPAFPSMGIWRNVELQVVQNVLVSEITADTFKTTNFWRIVVTIFFETFGIKNIEIKNLTHIFCTLEELNLKNSTYENLIITNNRASATISLDIPINKVEKWWPNGYGQQKLYLVNIKVRTESDISEKNIKIGFRTVELVQDTLEKGLSFYFKVNEIPIFAKGSNWIPSSIFPEYLENEKTLRKLLESVKETHMNMLRVWGGGVYESELFYSIADAYGIMIWQDFMFACNMYPTTEIFLNNVRKEISQNMRRLKHHPSIVLWAGNNENEVALFGNWYGTGSNQIYTDDYIKLYVHTIKNEVVNNDLTRPFVISSPSNGLYSEEKNYTKSNPTSTFYGDVHYYNYMMNGWDTNHYPITRFASEYGFQALPSIWTLMSASKNSSDLLLNSSFFKHRQHLPGGNGILKLLITKNFILPNNSNPLIELFDYIYLSQVTQAVSIKVETESYRQMKSSLNELGQGLTMGALYWQLNDVWQAPSWSSIDFQGRWKMLHYYAKNFFHPVIITSRLSAANELLIYIVSDLLHSLTDLTVEIIVYEWSSAKSIHTSKIYNITVGPNESQLVGQYWIDNFLETAGCGPLAIAKEKCMLELILKDINGTKKAPSNYVYPITLKNVTLPKDFLTVTIKSEATVDDHGMDFQVEIASPTIALFVWLEIGNINGKFSDNGFHIFNGMKNITFRTDEITTVNYIKKNLIVTSLSKIYDSKLRETDIQILNDELNKVK